MEEFVKPGRKKQKLPQYPRMEHKSGILVAELKGNQHSPKNFFRQKIRNQE